MIFDLDNNDIKRNGSGYYDPTAYTAIKHVEESKHIADSDERFFKLLNSIFDICELSGFHIENRIIMKDKKTGKIYR